MKTQFRPFLFTALLVTVLAAVGHAQDPATSPKPEPAQGGPTLGPITPLKVQIVIARFQGDKKISSLPYTLSVNANDGTLVRGQYNANSLARLRTGAQVAVASVVTPKDTEKVIGIQGPTPFTYKDVGTNIDCTAHSTGDGRFSVSISIEDSSVYSESQVAQGAQTGPMLNAPSFRSFQVSNVVIMRDGQTTEFTAATDKVSGEVTRVNVTVSVEK